MVGSVTSLMFLSTVSKSIGSVYFIAAQTKLEHVCCIAYVVFRGIGIGVAKVTLVIPNFITII